MDEVQIKAAFFVEKLPNLQTPKTTINKPLKYIVGVVIAVTTVVGTTSASSDCCIKDKHPFLLGGRDDGCSGIVGIGVVVMLVVVMVFIGGDCGIVMVLTVTAAIRVEVE